MSSIELRRQRRAIAERMQQIVATAEAEGRDLSAEERSNWDQADTDYNGLSERIERLERLEAQTRDGEGFHEGRSAEREISVGHGGVVSGQEPDESRAAFAQFLRGGMSSLSPEQRSVMTRRYASLDSEARALSAGTDATGGYTVPDGFAQRLEESMLAFGGMRQSRATVYPSDTGADIPFPTVNDTSNSGAILAENTQVSDQDAAFNTVNIPSYMYTSKLVLVSYQLLQDSAFDIEGWLANALGTRIARATNAHMTTADGNGKPHGVVTGASSALTAAAQDEITYDELVELEHSIDPAYRSNAQFMFHDSMLKKLKQMTDGNSRPLWLPGMALREPDSLMGYGYVINQSVAAPATGTKSILFGDFSKYIIRDVRGMQLLRLTERYADYLQVGFLAFSRHGGRLVDAGTDPIKYITQA